MRPDVAQVKRLTAYVSGIVQKVGYRARVIQIANAFGLKGIIENLSDGRVKIIAEGDDDKLRWFEEAIDIKNTLIHVSVIDKEYSQAIGEFSSFSKVVGQGETDSRLDQGIDILKEILGAIKGMSSDIKGMDANIKGMSSDIKGMRADIKDMDKNLGNKIDDARTDIVGEIRELRRDIKEDELVRMKSDIAEIKAKLGL